MTNFQKIVKYLAVLLAVALIAGMAAGVVKGISVIAKFADLTTSDGKVEDVREETVKKIRVKLFRTDLVIVEGESFNAETDNEDVTVKEVFGTLVVEENSKSIVDSIKKSEVVLTVPEGYTLEQIKITTGAGRFTAEVLNAEKIDLNFGAGAVDIDKMISGSKTEITGGAGKVEICDGKTNDLDLDMGVGKLRYRAEITGKSEIDCGMGGMDLILLGGEESYSVDIDKGLGLISINGVSYDDGIDYGDGENKIDINGGVGEIKVKFE